LTGTVPIYWGFSNVTQVFDPRGIITIDSVDDLHDVFKKIDQEDYQNRMDGILNNFNIAKKYVYMDHNIWEYFFQKFFEGEL
jgi:hypothetical protein